MMMMCSSTPVLRPRSSVVTFANAAGAVSHDQRNVTRKVLSSVLAPYLKKNATAASALELIRANSGGTINYDHFTFRTFGVDGCGIQSIAQLFEDLGYECRDEMRFPAKKLRSFWYAPPSEFLELEGDGLEGPLPRIFIAELLVDQLSSSSQEVIRKYTEQALKLAKHAGQDGLSALNCFWETPTLVDYQLLEKENEYAAWILVNGYALNHLAVSVHRLNSELQDINKLNEFLQSHGVRLNSDGGVLKSSPDGSLLQSSTVADTIPYTFAGGEKETTTASYIEFAQRLVLAPYNHLPASELKEWHRREGFDLGNAYKIMESTSSLQTAAN